MQIQNYLACSIELIMKQLNRNTIPGEILFYLQYTIMEKWKSGNKLCVTTHTKKYCYLCILVLSQLLIDWYQKEDWLII